MSSLGANRLSQIYSLRTKLNPTKTTQCKIFLKICWNCAGKYAGFLISLWTVRDTASNVVDQLPSLLDVQTGDLEPTRFLSIFSKPLNTIDSFYWTNRLNVDSYSRVTVVSVSRPSCPNRRSADNNIKKNYNTRSGHSPSSPVSQNGFV